MGLRLLGKPSPDGAVSAVSESTGTLLPRGCSVEADKNGGSSGSCSNRTCFALKSSRILLQVSTCYCSFACAKVKNIYVWLYSCIKLLYIFDVALVASPLFILYNLLIVFDPEMVVGKFVLAAIVLVLT